MKKLFTILLFILLSSINCFADIYYVRTNGNDDNSGQSWSEAFATLQKALESVVEGDEIWVAEGTYFPTKDIEGIPEPEDNRTKTFQMRNAVAIYGGFPTTGEPTMDEREWNIYETILSGDLNQDDVWNEETEMFENRDDNCYNIFYHPEGLNLDNSAIIDGFTLTKAHTYNTSHYYPSAIHNNENSPSIINCKFTFNYSYPSYGAGAIFNENSSTYIDNCVFSYNIGGAMFNLNSSTFITNCVFINNLSSYFGAAIEDKESNNTIINSVFINNVTDLFGGGGSYHYESTVMIINCTYANNRAIGEIGAWGGGIGFNASNAIIQNSIFWGNKADERGNEIDITTVPSNKVIIENSCFADSVTNKISNIHIQGLGDIIDVDLIDNINENPLFVDPENGDFRILGASPCVDAGNNEFIDAEYDIRGPGFPRKLNGQDGGPGIVDIGAYEYQFGNDPVPVVEYINEKKQINIYPNPTSDFITFVTESNFNSSISIYNVLGEKVYSEKVKNSEQVQINVEFLTNGTYILVLKNDDGLVSKSFNVIR